MTEKKHNPNPFIRLAQEAKERQQAIPVITGNRKDAKSKQGNPKPAAGPVSRVMRKTGRGG
jgi:hypothetical protein